MRTLPPKTWPIACLHLSVYQKQLFFQSKGAPDTSHLRLIQQQEQEFSGGENARCGMALNVASDKLRYLLSQIDVLCSHGSV